MAKKKKPLIDDLPRPKDWSEEYKDELAMAYGLGLTLEQIARGVGCTRKTLAKHLGEDRLEAAKLKKFQNLITNAHMIALGQVRDHSEQNGGTGRFLPKDLKTMSSMTMFLCKTLLGLQETHKINGEVKHELPPVILKAASIDQLQNLKIKSSLLDAIFSTANDDEEETWNGKH